MVVVVMGVTGCGKSTIGRLLARRLGVPFYDGDSYHPEANVKKMASGVPLDDNDRLPWLLTLAEEIARWDKLGGAVLACSALKERYREILRSRLPVGVRFVHLAGDKEVIRERLLHRQGHFMPAALLDSQYEALEPPADAITVSITIPAKAIIATVCYQLTGKESFRS